MDIKKFKKALAITIASIAGALAIYSGINKMHSWEYERAYAKLSPKQQTTIDSLKKAGVKENEFYSSVTWMGEALIRLQKMESEIKDLKSKVDNYERGEEARGKGEFIVIKNIINAYLGELEDAENSLKSVNPKIFNTTDTRTKIRGLRAMLNQLGDELQGKNPYRDYKRW